MGFDREKERRNESGSQIANVCEPWPSFHLAHIRARALSITPATLYSARCSKKHADKTWNSFLVRTFSSRCKLSDTAFYLKDGALPKIRCNVYTPRGGWQDATWQSKTKPKRARRTLDRGQSLVEVETQEEFYPTAGDYARFGQMLLNGGELDGVRVLGRKTVDMMIGNHTGDMTIPMTGPGFHWGLGVATYHGRDRFPLIRVRGYIWMGRSGWYNVLCRPKGRATRGCPDASDKSRGNAQQHLPRNVSALSLPVSCVKPVFQANEFELVHKGSVKPLRISRTKDGSIRQYEFADSPFHECQWGQDVLFSME